jgi:hypothetical protein
MRTDDAQPELSTKGEKWHRGARELLARYEFSGIAQFDKCYSGEGYSYGLTSIFHRSWADISRYDEFRRAAEDFKKSFRQARGLLASLTEEIKSRELLAATQLSLAISADEFETAQHLYESANNDEALLRAAGVVTRVALERHLFTVLDSHQIQVQLNPPTKKKADIDDVLVTLVKQSVITAIQQSQLASLFKVANNCAHPKEQVKAEDVKRLIMQGKELAAVIL